GALLRELDALARPVARARERLHRVRRLGGISHPRSAEAVAGVPAVQRAIRMEYAGIGSLHVIERSGVTDAKLAIGPDTGSPGPVQAVLAGQPMHPVGGAEGVDPHDESAADLDDAWLGADVLVGFDPEAAWGDNPVVQRPAPRDPIFRLRVANADVRDRVAVARLNAFGAREVAGDGGVPHAKQPGLGVVQHPDTAGPLGVVGAVERQDWMILVIGEGDAAIVTDSHSRGIGEPAAVGPTPAAEVEQHARRAD